MELWIPSRQERDTLAAILVANGYVVSQIQRPDPNQPYCYERLQYGLYVEENK